MMKTPDKVFIKKPKYPQHSIHPVCEDYVVKKDPDKYLAYLNAEKVRDSIWRIFYGNANPDDNNDNYKELMRIFNERFNEEFDL